MKFDIYKTILNSIKCFLLLGFVIIPITLSAQSKKDDEINLDKIPPRIIRACCAFGYDLKLWGVPFVNIDQVISIDDLNEHHYMGDKSEGIGTMYTHKGGFIDMPDILTSTDKSDRASQHFFFNQLNIVFGITLYPFGQK